MRASQRERRQVGNIRPSDGFQIMITCPGYWGKGEDGKAALKALEFSLDRQFIVYEIHPSTYINGDGTTVRNRDTPAPREVMRSAGMTKAA